MILYWQGRYPAYTSRAAELLVALSQRNYLYAVMQLSGLVRSESSVILTTSMVPEQARHAGIPCLEGIPHLAQTSRCRLPNYPVSPIRRVLTSTKKYRILRCKRDP